MTLPKDVIGLKRMFEFPQNECKCSTCVGCCKRNPGAFLPGEPEKVAEFLGEPLSVVLAKYLIIDYWYDKRLGSINFIMPKKQFQIGQIYAKFSDPFRSDDCVFLSDGECVIHPVKPFECRLDVHNKHWDMYSDDRPFNLRKSLAWQWYRKKTDVWNLIKGDE